MASGYSNFFDIAANSYVATVTFNPALYRTGKYMVQASSGDNHQASEVFVIHDNTYVYTKEVNLVYTSDPFVTYSATINTSSVTLLAKSSLPNTDLVVYGIELQNSSKATNDQTFSQEKILQYAQSMRAFYPDDKTDYVAKMAGTLYNTRPVGNLAFQIKEISSVFNSNEFNSLSVSAKNEFLRNYANTINNSVKEIQDSINNDLANYKDVINKVTVGTKISTITSQYNNEQAQKLLQLTLKPSVLSAIANTGS